MNNSSHLTPQKIEKKFFHIQKQREKIDLPNSIYGTLVIYSPTLAKVFLLDADNTEEVFEIKSDNGDRLEKLIQTKLSEHMKEHNEKIVALAIVGEEAESIGSTLWLELDIVPMFYTQVAADEVQNGVSQKITVEVGQYFDKENIAQVILSEDNEVIPSDLVTLADYQKITPPKMFARYQQLAKQFSGKNLLFISATPRGGGVALMRHAMMRLFRMSNVDAHWHILIDRAEIFQITKTKFHNVLQAVADPSIRLTEDEQEAFKNWSEENYELLKKAIEKADVIVIDDPQPSGLMPHIHKDFPDKPVIYRSHIQIVSDLIDKPDSPQQTTWNFLWQFIQLADMFIAHPIKEFVPSSVDREKVVYLPATSDQLDGLNKPLNEAQVEYYLKLFNAKLIEDGQTPLDTDRSFICQIARFDPSKGIPDVVESFRKLRQKLDKAGSSTKPQLVLAGHGSIDDPDGIPILNLIRQLLLEDRYREIAADIKIARLPHIDQLLDVLLQESKVVLQLSHKEGFEIKVSEALAMGKPVISYRAGGIPLQIKDRVNGVVIPQIGDTDAVAEELFSFFTDQEKYQQFSQAAREQVRDDVWTVPNCIAWLYAAEQLLQDKNFRGKEGYLFEMAMGK